MTDQSEALRLQAEKRRSKLLARGNERIKEIETGFTTKCVTETETTGSPHQSNRIDSNSQYTSSNIQAPVFNVKKLPRGCLIFLTAIISVFTSYLWPNDNIQVFYRLSKIALTNFCIMQITLQAYEIRSIKVLFNFGTLIPLIQLLITYLTKEQYIISFILLICIISAYLNIVCKVDSMATLYKYLLRGVFSNITIILDSFEDGVSYFSDYALFSVFVALFILSLPLFCRIIGHIRV